MLVRILFSLMTATVIYVVAVEAACRTIDMLTKRVNHSVEISNERFNKQVEE